LAALADSTLRFVLNGLPRILIIRLGAIGDVVRVVPALHSLRDAFPHAQIDWAIERRASDVIDSHPCLDQVFVFERGPRFIESTRAFWRYCRALRANHYDIVIDFHGILKSGIITAVSGAPDRYGFARPRSREGSSLAINHRADLGVKALNRVEENLRLAELLAPRRQSLDVSFHVSPEVREQVEDYAFSTFESGKLLVLIHAPVDRREKRWPVEHFARLADMLQGDGRFEVVLTWGPGQLEYVLQIVEHSRRKPHVAPEMASLKHLMWLCHCADLFFGVDTGPMHIASAMGTPVVAIFGGTDPRRHAPLFSPSLVLTAEQFDGGRVDGIAGEEKLRRIPPEGAYDACVRLAAGRLARSFHSSERTVAGEDAG
jgi:lipopolysaccharide heptosyltransferase I